MSYNALYRPLRNGKEFNGLFPTPKGERVRLGKGDTHTSIELIIKWALENNHEVSRVATKLKKSSLEETCFTIHDFLFNHFQYKADREAQLLRSPAYAWKYRHEGIDCKSYSIIASCILLQLGIKHYIRKIKQPTFNPENFTHVYVIVPVNQSTGTLNDGYCTIDGTLKSTQEPIYIETKDFFMDKLSHYGLQAPAQLNGFDYNDVKTLFSGLDCIGGSAYSDDRLKSNVQIINTLFSNIIEDINKDVISNNAKNLGKLSAEFLSQAKLLRETFVIKKSSQSWNSCSRGNFSASIKLMDFYINAAQTALKVWVVDNFDVVATNQGTYSITNVAKEGLYKIWGSGISKSITISEPFASYIKKSKQINAFALTQYVIDASKANSFNPAIFLQGLSTVLVSFQNNGNPSSSGVIDQNGQVIYETENLSTKPTKNAGTGLLIGVLAFIGLTAWGLNKFKNK